MYSRLITYYKKTEGLKQKTGLRCVLPAMTMLCCTFTYAQSDSAQKSSIKKNTTLKKKDSAVKQEDVVDFIAKVCRIKVANKSDSESIKPGKLLVAVFPAAGYALQSGVVGIVATNISFYTAPPPTNLSSITFNPQYSIMNQIVLPCISSIFTKDNKFNFLGDYRYYKYPSYTYGLGSRTLLNDVDSIDYRYIKFYQEALIRLAPNLYGGFGYNLDYHYDITDNSNNTDFEQYDNNATKTVSSGVVAHLKYDTRDNINNPETSIYASVTYRYNSTILGSDNNWQYIQAEIRKYFQLSPVGHYVLAFWSWNEFTFGGRPPYLDLPSTGWDTYNNTGRGYIQGRFRGANFVYLESEFRFDILRSGLLGGVVFANAETVSKRLSDGEGGIISPGYGAGIRIKLNRYSKTNIAVDYGFGTGGSRGFFFNIGEVF
jgi:hypothetical protein